MDTSYRTTNVSQFQVVVVALLMEVQVAPLMEQALLLMEAVPLMEQVLEQQQKLALHIVHMLLMMINAFVGTDTNSMDKNVFKLLEPTILMEQAILMEAVLLMEQILELQKPALHIVHMLLMMINVFA